MSQLETSTIPLLPTSVSTLSIDLKPSISRINFYAYLLSIFATISSFAFFNAATPLLLSSHYGVSKDEAGSINGTIVLVDQVYALILGSFWGVFSDKIGRKFISVIGISSMALSMVFYPFGNSIYYWVICWRLVYSQGAAASAFSLVALMADYVQDQSKAKASGYIGLVSGLGAVFGIFVLLAMQAVVKIEYTYLIAAGWMTLVAILLAFGLKSDCHVRSEMNHGSFIQLFRGGIEASKDRKVALSYYMSLMARAQSIFNLTLLALWVKNFFPDDEEGQEEGNIKFQMYSGIAQTLALVVSPILGLIVHHTSLNVMLYFIPVVGVATFTSFCFIPNAQSPWVFSLTLGMGTLEVGYIILSQILVTRHAPPELRGSVIGFFSICGNIGLIISSKLGGYLFDVWTIKAPFYLFILLNALSIIFVTIVKLRENRPLVEHPREIKTCPLNAPLLSN